MADGVITRESARFVKVIKAHDAPPDEESANLQKAFRLIDPYHHPVMKNPFRPIALSAILAFAALPLRADTTPLPEIAFGKLTDEILADDFEFQPLNAVGLGLHQYDGKFVDLSRASVDAECRRLHAFLTRLAAIDPAGLSAPSALDYKLLKLGTENTLFQMEEEGMLDHNPMTYAGVFDPNVYLKRDYAPLADRLRSIVAVERQVPALFAAAHANLVEVLPKSEVELAIVIARATRTSSSTIWSRRSKACRTRRSRRSSRPPTTAPPPR